MSTLRLQLDGRVVEARAGETIWSLARREGVAIPHLCHQPDTEGMAPAGNCRACMVEVEGERVLAASCCRLVQAEMRVHTASARALQAQRTVLELLRAEVAAAPPLRHDSELERWCRTLGVVDSRFAAREPVPVDDSHPAMTVNLSACIQCTRCVRACREVQGNDVIGLAHRGHHARIVFDQGDPMGASSCVGCGECIQACPTGALAPADGGFAAPAARQVDSICAYCGVGCAVRVHVEDERIVRVDGRDGPANAGRLCVKGRFGHDYVHHPARLTAPLIRRDDAPDQPGDLPPEQWRSLFREASWDEALDRVAGRLLQLREAHGPQALAGFGSAKGSNEEAYLFQKLVRTGFGSNNVDHCTRLCHASSVAALLEGLGSAAVSNPLRDVAHADLVLLIGANPTVNHPVGATWLKNALDSGTRLVLADPRRTELHRKAWRTLQFTAGTDVALLNALTHTVIAEGLVDDAFIRERTRDFEALRIHVEAFSPEAMASVCGIAAATLREVARAFATAPRAMILWGMGVSQHSHGTANARALIALCLVCGQIGRRGTGLHPLRGQNNVQGASDAGLIPMMLPDYRRVDDAPAREAAEAAWGVAAGSLDPRPGLTVVEIINAAHAGLVRGLLVQGENPAMSDPDLAHARAALARLDHLAVIDLFLTETAALADVVLPATAWPEKTGTVTNTDRLVQRGRRAVEPPGDARADLWITHEIGRRMGLGWDAVIDPRGGERGVAGIYEEMRGLMPTLRGIPWSRLASQGAVTYPCDDPAKPGQQVLFAERFALPDGLARLVPARAQQPPERPDAGYPLVLVTGRQLEHWHTGSMTRRAGVLHRLEPGPTASVHPALAAKHGLQPGARIRLESRRGAIDLAIRVDESLAPDTVFVPFAYAEAAANALTHAELDPVARIAAVKYCAVRITQPEPTPA